MSHHSDENAIFASTDSFWEVGNYKRTTKRIEDGHRLCDDLMKLVSERAEIEKMYAKSLKDWAKKWNNIIEKGPEYGTTEAAWKGVLMEAEQRCDLHMRVRENLINDVHSNVKQWQRDSYHKSMMGQLKEKKDIEDMFKKAQKPWAKLLEKVNKNKQDYHNACKSERSAQNQERNASGDSSLSPDQRFQLVKKLQDRVSKAKEEVSRGKERYEIGLHDITEYNPKYIEEMTHVFEKAQEAESKRLTFFKEMLFATHKCLNVSSDPSLPRIYEEFNHTVANADYEKDLKWWSNNHGVNMPMNWPSFEEYTPDLHRISKKNTKGAVSGAGDVTLTSVKGGQNHTSPATSKASDNNRHSAIRVRSFTVHNLSNNVNPPPFSSSGYVPPANPPTHKATLQLPASANFPARASFLCPSPKKNTFNGVSGDDDEWDYSDRMVDPNKPGVPVRALYDYEGVESDELSFKVGEVFEKLEDEDEQGWCTGRKDGRIGLYPANYVEPI